jgi:hypothetical protein
MDVFNNPVGYRTRFVISRPGAVFWGHEIAVQSGKPTPGRNLPFFVCGKRRALEWLHRVLFSAVISIDRNKELFFLNPEKNPFLRKAAVSNKHGKYAYRH